MICLPLGHMSCGRDRIAGDPECAEPAQWLAMVAGSQRLVLGGAPRLSQSAVSVFRMQMYPRPERARPLPPKCLNGGKVPLTVREVGFQVSVQAARLSSPLRCRPPVR